MVQTTVRPVSTVLRMVRMTIAAARASSPVKTKKPLCGAVLGCVWQPETLKLIESPLVHLDSRLSTNCERSLHSANPNKKLPQEM